MKYNNYKARVEIINKVLSEHELIEVRSGKCRYNYKCHMNAVHEAIKKGDKKIAMCIYIEDNYPIIHFINYRKDKFIDNTLGVWSGNKKYYFIKWITEEEFWEVNSIFGAYREVLRNSLSFWVRLTSDYNA